MDRIKYYDFNEVRDIVLFRQEIVYLSFEDERGY